MTKNTGVEIIFQPVSSAVRSYSNKRLDVQMNQHPTDKAFEEQHVAPLFKDTVKTGDALSVFIETEAARPQQEGGYRLTFFVPDMNCAGCMGKIERHFARRADLQRVRVNLARKEVAFTWPLASKDSEGVRLKASDLADDLQRLGFEARPLMPGANDDKYDQQFRHLLWCMAVAGFAAANVMLLSVSVWSGATGATRDLFHWLSALIALPAIAYAGQPFFRSGFQALKAGHVNMDVPISLAVILAGGLSLFETINHGEHAFFDAAVSLLFFLLIGRTLDHMMRARAFHGVRQLLSLKTETGVIIDADGVERPIPIRDIEPLMKVLVRAGETIPVDGVVLSGLSDVDWSIVSGESVPKTAKPSDMVYSGLMNLSGPLIIETKAVGEQTLLAEIIRLMEAAQSRKPRYRQLAERAASFYVPFVHSAAALTLLGWLLFGAAWQTALYHAIAVLIITCPCALGLAVPVVQVAASAIAQRAGVLMKDGAALEALSEIDTVVFDKTGTLTLAKPSLAGRRVVIAPGHSSLIKEPELLGVIGQLAAKSLHPVSVQLARALQSERGHGAALVEITEHSGLGLEANWQGGRLRLGHRDWCGVPQGMVMLDDLAGFQTFASFVTDEDESTFAAFSFQDRLRDEALDVVRYFQSCGFEVHLFSGDRLAAVERTATQLGLHHYKADMKPQDKAAAIGDLEAEGRRVFMVGDGINDGPSLQAAHVSLSPAGASDLAKVTASFALLKESLRPLIWLHKLSRLSCRLIWQNFYIAALYNLIAVPLAVAGGVTPIVAALAMSASSLIVMGNGLRLYYLTRTVTARG